MKKRIRKKKWKQWFTQLPRLDYREATIQYANFRKKWESSPAFRKEAAQNDVNPEKIVKNLNFY